MERTRVLLGNVKSDALVDKLKSRITDNDPDELVDMIVQSEVKIAVRDAPPHTIGEFMEMLGNCGGYYTRGVWKDLFDRYEKQGRNDFWVGYVPNPDWKGFGELMVTVSQVIERTVIFEIRHELGLAEYIYD